MKKNLLKSNIAALAVGILLSSTVSAQLTAVASGDWSSAATWGGTAPSPTISNQNVTIPSGITVTLDQDVTFTGLLNTFQVNGVLTSTTSNWVRMNSGSMTGTGTLSIGKLNMTSLSAISFGGTLNLKSFVNSVGTLAFTSVANVSDTLELENGTISLNTNGNLSMSSGATIKVNDGKIAINSGVFNAGNTYNLMYVGTSKNTGVELSSTIVQDLYVNLNDNTESLTLNNNVTINGALKLTSGNFKINSRKVTLKGDFVGSAGATMETNNATDLIIEGSGAMTNALMFKASSTINDVTINRPSGTVMLGNALNIDHYLYLMDGNLSIENGASLNINSGTYIHVEKGMIATNGGTFTPASGYNVEYAGSTDITSGMEIAAGLNTMMVNFLNSTNKVVLNTNASVAGKFQLMKGKLDLNGKTLMLNGTMDQTTSAWFVGSPSSELHLNLASVNQNTLYFDNANASSQTLGKLKINTAGTSSINTIVLGSKLIIANELSFLAGKMELGNGDLEIMPSASITGYDDTRYIITSDQNSGVLIQNVTSGGAYVTFPIGLSTGYSPAYVQQNAAGAAGNFSAKCHLLYNSTLKAVNRTWMVEGMGVATVDANLRFGWQAASEVNGFDRTNAFVSHYTNNMWDVTAAGTASAGVNSTYELSRTGLTSLSPFAVVENGTLLKVNELSKLDGIDMYPNPSKDVLNIKVANASDNLQYELIDVTGRTILTTSNNNAVNKFDVSSLNSGCYFVKITNLADNKTITKRFVKQ